MDSPTRLLHRLNEIGRSVERSGHAEALIGLGSVGRDISRLDTYSDLDFFLIVENGYKTQFVENLDWLSCIVPLSYQFRNTVDGWKVLFADAIFAEFAVFEQVELSGIPFAPGRIIWKKTDITDSVAEPTRIPAAPDSDSPDWHLGEALTNLYIGMNRYLRGEKLSAARFVQQFAVDRVLALYEIKGNENRDQRDPFSNERRLEIRHPELARQLPLFVPGYEYTPESALAILDYLCARYPVNKSMELEIRRLCASKGA